MKRAAQFVGLSFGLSWLSMPLFMHFGGELRSPLGLIFSMGYMWVPGLVALSFRPGKAALGLNGSPNYVWLLAWLAPPLLMLLTLAVSLLLPGVRLSWEMAGLIERVAGSLSAEQVTQLKAAMQQSPVHPLLLMLLQGLIAGASVNSLAALGEELGWRGLLYREFAGLNFWHASLLIGGIWGLWHAPLILQGHNYPQHPQLGVIMMILWCILLAPFFSWIRLRGRSVLAAALLHGSLNGTIGLSFALLQGGNDLLVGATGLAGMLVLAGLNLALYLSAPQLRLHSLAELEGRLD